ncbi:MAG: hypothetical protein E6G97_01980 [Alphaproteobacteria bacterium]|nr:MAG: hypothetical protein E6G97_01980 [Alphaproteobacteria bacterium]
MTPAARACLDEALDAAMRLPGRITNAVIRAGRGAKRDDERLEQLKIAREGCAELFTKIGFAELALKTGRRVSEEEAAAADMGPKV